MVFRCDPDGHGFETLAHNFRNNYEVAIDSFGTLWQSDNDDDGNRGVRINYVMEFGNYGYTDEMTGAGWSSPRTNIEAEIPLRHWYQNDPDVVPNLLLTGGGSPTGICVYEGSLLPEVYRNQVIHTGVYWGTCSQSPVGAWSAREGAVTPCVIPGKQVRRETDFDRVRGEVPPTTTFFPVQPAEPIAAADLVVEVLLGPGRKNEAHLTEEVTIVLGIDCLPIGRNGDLRRAGDDRSTIAGSNRDKNSRGRLG